MLFDWCHCLFDPMQVSVFSQKEKQLCSQAVSQIGQSWRRIGRAALPLCLFLLARALPVLYRCWCLYLLACPRRRRATDFTRFYWLIWLCSCQQLQGSQQSGNLREKKGFTASPWLFEAGGFCKGGGKGLTCLIPWSRPPQSGSNIWPKYGD